METQDPADLPVSDNRVDNRVGVLAELLAFAHRQLVAEVTGDDMRLVVVAGSPVGLGIIDILPSRLTA